MTIRKIGLISRTYRSINRYRQILTVFAKYGFGDLIETLRVGQYIELGLQLVSRGRPEPHEKQTRAERVRHICEELGPTFVKLGQVLSTRPDLIPPDWAEELEKLQHQVPPFPFAQVHEIVERALGQPLATAFAEFDEQPIAAASIAQVHRATMTNGEIVAVKVQRPGIRELIEVDLEILLHLATLAERHLEDVRLHRPTRIVHEFARTIENELDFQVEAGNLERFGAVFLNDDTVYVPKVYRGSSAEQVLTLEFIDGIRPNELPRLLEAGHDLKLLARRGADLILKQIFAHGFFHADPHPGNVFVLPHDVICYLDFGMMGRVDRRTRERFSDLVAAVAGRDAEKTARVLLDLLEHDDDVEPDLRLIERDVAELIDVHLVARLEEFAMGKLLRHLLELSHRHRLRLPPELVLMLKALATAEKVGAALDPDLDMVALAAPFVRRLQLERYRPARMARDLYESGADILQFVREIPGNLRDLLRLTRHGALKIGFEHRGLDHMLEVNERIANRVSFAIVVAALIVGSSVIVHSQIPPKWYEIPVVGLVGFVTAGVLGLWLLIAILRHGRL
jgi:ubiquinone biosynthesis protein